MRPFFFFFINHLKSEDPHFIDRRIRLDKWSRVEIIKHKSLCLKHKFLFFLLLTRPHLPQVPSNTNDAEDLLLL